MRALFVATYPELGPSSRYRVCQFLPELERHGIQCTFLPFLSNDFYGEFYVPGRTGYKAAWLGAATLKRLTHALTSSRFDLVFVQREAALIGPPFFEYVSKFLMGRPLVFDLDDAIYLSPDEIKQQSAYPRFRRWLNHPRKAEQIAKAADQIIVASEFTEFWARQYTDQVTVIPTVVDGRVFTPKTDRSAGKPVIGWVGTHSTAPQLDLVVPALEKLAKKHEFKVRIVGAARDISIPGVDVENLRWDVRREVEDFRSLDIGLCPLFDDEWSRGKPGFKPLVYMACGVPQVSSPIGDVTRFMKPGESGFFARTERDWYEQLDRFLSDPELRARIGLSARKAFEAGATLETEVPALVRVLRAAHERSARRRAS